LQADIEAAHSRLQSQGKLSDPGQSETQLLNLLDETVFIVKGQFVEIDKLKRRVRELESAGKTKRQGKA
jgi:hypothetical protein